jgi:hypothetical protein
MGVKQISEVPAAMYAKCWEVTFLPREWFGRGSEIISISGAEKNLKDKKAVQRKEDITCRLHR